MVQSGVPEASHPMPAAPVEPRRHVETDPVAAEVDRVLDKISAHGLGALTLDERRTLDEAKHLDPQQYEHLQGLIRYSGVQLAVKRRRR